jgi:ATP-binding cassette subfamily C protein
MKQGRTAESGTHKELMHWGGSYASLYKAQEELETYSGAQKESVILDKLKEEDGEHEDTREKIQEERRRRSGAAIMGRLIGLVKPLLPVMLTAIFLGILGFLCSIFVSILAGGELVRRMGEGIADGALPGLMPHLTPLSFGILLVLTAVLRGILHYGEQYCNHFIAFRLLAIIRHKVFGALRKLCPAKLETRDKGNLISILTSDIELLEVFYAHTISPIAIAFFVSLIMVLYLGSIYLPAGLIALAGYLCVGILIPLYIGRKNGQTGLSFRNSFGELNSYLLESMRGLDETLQYGDGEGRKEGLDQGSRALSEKQKALSRFEALQRSVTDAALWIFSLALYICILTAYAGGEVPFSSVLICIMALPNSFGPVLALSRLANDLGQTLASGERVLSLLEEAPAVEEVPGQGEAVTLVKGMEADHVTFGYGEEKILKDYSLKVPAGVCIGIHGRSGCGKSTLLRLLMRFWDPQEGQILLEERDLKTIPTESLRCSQAFVAQETHLFHTSLAENIAVGRQDASMEEIEEAARKASIHDFIMDLPEGYQTKAGELGDTLSEGQKQRIGLARAFLYDAPILLLDEPTSSLDALSEGMILRALEAEKQERKRTIVLVSHRASTMSLADQVVEMTGRVS